jgi:hypothetical protein
MAAAVFYASGETAFNTGTTLFVDGGMTAGYAGGSAGGVSCALNQSSLRGSPMT